MVSLNMIVFPDGVGTSNKIYVAYLFSFQKQYFIDTANEKKFPQRKKFLTRLMKYD
jgi:hypothetical protein